MNAEGLGRKLLLTPPPRWHPENPWKADCGILWQHLTKCSPCKHPKDSFEAIFCLAGLFEFSGVIFRDPPRISFKTSIKIASRGYFFYLRLFFASRGLFQKIASKESLGLSSSLNASTAKRDCLGQGKASGWPPAICPPKRPRPFTHYIGRYLQGSYFKPQIAY